MDIKFSKFHGAGNDFILLDNRKEKYSHLIPSTIKWLCDRHFGIGADGLIMLEKSKTAHFVMRYFNADGNPGSMCGNGSRCAVFFAQQLKIVKRKCSFEAIDGRHEATIEKGNFPHVVSVSVKMNDVFEIDKAEKDYIINTGSPHLVRFVKDIYKIEVKKVGNSIRYNKRFKKEGINVNFVSEKKGQLLIRTYERGVEDETLSCGTGITASAIAAHHAGIIKKNNIDVIAEGGKLNVKFDAQSYAYQNIILSGNAAFVYKGNFKILI